MNEDKSPNASSDSASSTPTAPSPQSPHLKDKPVDALRQSAAKPGEHGSDSLPPKSANAKVRSTWVGIGLGLVLAVAALGAGLWWQQQRFETVAREIATRLQQSDRQVEQASQQGRQALALAQAQRDVVEHLSRELAVTSNELKTLQQAWQTANEGLDQTLLLNDLRRLINMANQELSLFGNVSSAISILSSVQTMLKTQNAPTLKALYQAVMTDVARLRAAPQIDLTGLSAKLDSLIALTTKSPLMAPVALEAPRAADAAAKAPTASETANVGSQSPSDPWWRIAYDKTLDWTVQTTSILTREFAELVSIRKANDPQALLLTSEQSVQLRANVRAILLNAQLALMMRQSDIWRSELTEVQSILNTRYDTQALDTKASLKLVDELLSAPVTIQVPTISATLNALASADRAVSIPSQSTDSSASSSEASTSETKQAEPVVPSGGAASASGQGS